jgi:hypothetical protein
MRERGAKFERVEDQPAPQGRNFLLIVGIDAYRHGLQPLANAVRDAMAFRDVLLEQYQFEKENCIELYNEEATRSRIIQTFDDLIERLNEDDNLVFYYAGHGQLVTSIQEGYWLLADAVGGERATYLSNGEVQQFMSHLRARHVFGVVDSCFSGALFRSAEAGAPSNLYHYRSRYLLTAGRHEPVADGRPGRHSPFADCLLEQLRRHPGPHLWVGDLCRAVLQNIRFNTDEQTPRGEPLQKVGHQGGEFAFVRKKDSIPSSPAPATPDVERTPGRRDASAQAPQRPVQHVPVTKEEGQKLIFISYAEDDADLKGEFAKQLSSLVHSGQVVIFSSDQIPPGSNREEVLQTAFERVDIFLFLISAHFLQPAYQQEQELAMNRCREKQAMVVPVYLRPCFWKKTAYARLQGLPRNGKPIVSWDNRDEAWYSVVQELYRII